MSVIIAVVVSAVAAAVLVPVVRRAINDGSRSQAQARSRPVPKGGFVDPVPSALPGESRSLLTSDITTKVVQEVWPAINEVGYDLANPELWEMTTPNVRTLIQTRLFCHCGLWSPEYSSLEVSAPREPSYPLTFVAELDQPRSPHGAEIQMVEFNKQSSGAPWIILHITGYGGTNRVLAAGASLAATPMSQTPDYPALDSLAGEFASLRQSGVAPQGNLWNNTVGASTDNEPTNTEDDFAQEHSNDAGAGLVAYAAFTVGSWSQVFWTGTADMVCATISGRVSVSPKPGVRMVQPPSRSNFGETVPPGTYASVMEYLSYEVCLDDPTPTLVDVVGLIGGGYLNAGLRA